MKTKLAQQEFGFTNWGGKRRGAGRKPNGERAGVSHARRPVLASRHPVLVTMRLRAGLRSLRYNDTYALLKDAFAAATRESFRVVEYSVQSNHMHLLVEANDAKSLGRGMLGLSVRIVRGLKKLWQHVGSVFADRYHARILRTPREVRNALVYVINNARKHGAWSAAHADPYSSGTWFSGWKTSAKHAAQSETSLPSASGTASSPAVSSSRFLARARTWLLSLGWQRHGLLDPFESPAAT